MSIPIEPELQGYGVQDQAGMSTPSLTVPVGESSRGQTLLPVFAHCNPALNGEKGLCIFICFSNLAWEN